MDQMKGVGVLCLCELEGSGKCRLLSLLLSFPLVGLTAAAIVAGVVAAAAAMVVAAVVIL